MKTATFRLSAIVFSAAAVVGVVLLGVVGSGGAAGRPTPLPFGSPESTWSNADGSPIVDLMPERVGVSTLDGGVLRNSDGSVVTHPFGDEFRGTISEAEAASQRDEVRRLQLEDACRRGVQVPIGAGGGGATMEESQANAKAALAKAIAENGGKSTRSACATP